MQSNLTKISEIATIYDGPHATPTKLNKGNYFLSISSLDKGRLDLSKSAFISDEDFKKWTRRVTPTEGDLLFSYETRLGEVALMPKDLKACLGRRMGLLRPDTDKVVPEYLLYAYLSPEFQNTIVKNTITGATVDRIALNEMGDFPIRIPPIEEQKAVASLLSNLDEKIALNNQINATLEQMAKTLYDYWFVQFDFPDENGKPYKSSGGEMVYNETLKRDIPKGWKVETLDKHISIKRGISYKSHEIQETGTPFLNLNSFYLNGSFKVEGTKFFNGTTKSENLLKTGDLVVAVTDVTRNADIIGKSFIVPNIYEESFLMSCDVAMIKSEKLPNSYLEKLFNSYNYHEYIKHYASGTLVLHLDTKGIGWFETFIPSSNVLKKYDDLVQQIIARKIESIKQNAELTKLRDWLLPMLMNGQITVQ